MDIFWQEFAEHFPDTRTPQQTNGAQNEGGDGLLSIAEALAAEENDNQSILLGQVLLTGVQWDDEYMQAQVSKMAQDYWNEQSNPRMIDASRRLNSFIDEAMAHIRGERHSAEAKALPHPSESPLHKPGGISATQPEVMPQERGILAASKKSEILSDPIQAPPGALLDIDIEELIEQLHQAVISDAPSLKDPSHQYVPPDFGMQMRYTSDDYKRDVESCKQVEEARTILGYMPSTSKRRRLMHGFDPVQIVRKQAIGLPKELASEGFKTNLTNQILPLYKPENFHGCPQPIYEAIAPALQLSSLFLTHPAASTYWLTLTFGKREPCKLAAAKIGYQTDRILLDEDINPKLASEFRRKLDNLANLVHFRFGLRPLGSDEPDYAFASTCCLKDYARGYHTAASAQPSRPSVICLHTDFYTTAKRLSLLKENADPAMVLRFTFHLALVLTHEIAHSLEIGHSTILLDGGPLFREAVMNNNAFAEAGEAWELKMFGGRVCPINLRIDCAYGLSIVDWPLQKELDYEPNIYYTIPMRWIWWIQQQATWDQLEWDAQGVILTKGCPGMKGFFHIPRTGARSVELGALNLLIWDDEADVQAMAEEDMDTSAGREGRPGKLMSTRPASHHIYGSAASRVREWSRERKRLEKRMKKRLLYGKKTMARNHLSGKVKSELEKAQRRFSV